MLESYRLSMILGLILIIIGAIILLLPLLIRYVPTLEELSREPSTIPWLMKVEKVTVREA